MTDLEEVLAHDYEIVRHKADERRTFGRMLDAAGLVVCVTLERPWVDANRDGLGDSNESRIPAGFYRCRRAMHHGKYEVWEVEGVPGRSAIHIHIGNLVQDSLGCVLVGSGFGDVNGQPGITGSKTAFEKFMRDSLALCAREGREHIWIRITDQLG